MMSAMTAKRKLAAEESGGLGSMVDSLLFDRL
jgi:hypothetical protein